MNTKFIKFAVVLLLWSSCSQQQPKNNYVVLAYVTAQSRVMPDPDYVTHINYAFGHVNETFNGIIINAPPRGDNTGRPSYEDRLRSIVELKKQKPSLKILLSIGGWGSGRFSEMAATETTRLAFAADCQRVVKEFNLDGIDMDWEYPTDGGAGISSSPADLENFTLLMRDIRRAIGKDKLLTFASVSDAKFVDFKAVNEFVDFVNVMTYDMGRPPRHHAALTNSAHTRISSAQSIDWHVERGIPIEKLTLGLPFYGRGINGIPGSLQWRHMINVDGTLGFVDRRSRKVVGLDGFEDRWDAEAQAPYWADTLGNFVMTYESPKSIAIKCEWLRQKGMLGAMYWEYSADDDQGTLRKAVYNGVVYGKYN